MTKKYENALNFLKFLIQCFYKAVVSESDKKLIELLYSKEPNQNVLNDFLTDWDIEKYGALKAIFLAYFMKNHPELDFPQYVKPRLEGLINYYRFKNIKLFENFSKILKLIAEKDIKVVLTGDIAIKYILSNNNFEHISIIIDRQDCDKVLKILSDNNYKFNKDKHIIKVLLEEYNEIDIIYRYDLDTKFKFVSDFICKLFCNSKEIEIYNTAVLLPSNEDLAYIEIIELAKNIKNNLSFVGMLYSLYRILFLVNNNSSFDWNKVINIAKTTHTTVQLKLSSLFIDEIIPDFIPAILKNDNLFKKEIINYHNWARYRRKYNEEIRPTLSQNVSCIYVTNIKNNFIDAQNSIKNILRDTFSLLKNIISIIFNIPCLLLHPLLVRIKYIIAKIIRNNPLLLSLYYSKKDKEDSIETK